VKLLSFSARDLHSYGLINENGIVELAQRTGHRTLKDLIAADGLADAKRFANEKPDFSLDDIAFLPVIPDPAHIWCLAINYQDHIDEIKEIGIQREAPKQPAVFMRYSDTLVGHGQPLLKPFESADYDFEAELAVIIGRGGDRIPESEAMDHVAGYTAFNDASVRDWQFHTRQIAPGKNFRASGSLGPWMVTRDEIADPDALAIKARLNGVALQDSSTRYMMHKIPRFIAYVSTFLALKPGDILATGTPSGVGFSRRPPIFMKAGDLIEVELEGIGILSNPVLEG
jgi:2-keto-4-pentenoate hydratase/2-oxohepta-3-ene-1,7-dioic acid hydratase in catechol pathway